MASGYSFISIYLQDRNVKLGLKKFISFSFCSDAYIMRTVSIFRHDVYIYVNTSVFVLEF